MAFSSGPSIVKDGLVMYLDAANVKSYPGSGTTWNDLNNSFDGNLVNSPVFSSNVINLNGINDYISINGSGSNNNVHSWTSDGSVGSSTLFMEIWVRTNDTSGRIISKPWNGSGQYNMILSANIFSLLGNTSTALGFTSIATNTWRHLVVWATSNQLGYVIDGSITSTISHSVVGGLPSSGNSNLPLVIGTAYPYGEGWAGNDGFSLGGSISMFRKYNRILTLSEIQQNYNATKSRFGL